MALKPCWECNKKISTLARSCPSCGAPKPIKSKKNISLGANNKMKSSLGIETLGGIFTKIIDKSRTLTARESQVFSTAEDNQPAISVRVLQGDERFSAFDNKVLGEFELTGVPPSERGVPQIEVTFEIDKKGILNVYAKDKGTGKFQKVTLKASKSYKTVNDDEKIEATWDQKKGKNIYTQGGKTFVTDPYQEGGNTNSNVENLIEDVWEGRKPLGESFWLYYALLNGIISFVSAYLSEEYNNNLFLLIALASNIWAGIGTWNSATNYQHEKISINQPYGWAYAAKIMIVLNFLTIAGQSILVLNG